MSVRLNKVTKEFNIGLQTAVDFLKKKGYDDVEASPNCKITDQQYELLQKEFSSDKGLRSEATQLIQNRQEKSKERKEASKQKRQAEEMASAKPKASYKVVGHIELDKHGMPVKKGGAQGGSRRTAQGRGEGSEAGSRGKACGEEG